MKKLVMSLGFATLGCGLALGMTTAQWIIDESSVDQDSTFDSARDWFEPSNWTNGFVAAGGDVIAQFSNPGTNWKPGLRYVKLGQNLTVGGIKRSYKNTQSLATWDANKRVILGGDNVITIESTGAPDVCGINVYANLVLGNLGGTPMFAFVDICGPLVNESGRAIGIDSSGVLRFRCDKWAGKEGGLIADIAPGGYKFDGTGHVSFIAPVGSDGFSGLWDIEEGSAIVRLHAGATVRTLSAGTGVSGDGIPEGAFVKRIYSDSLVEISAPARKTAEGTELRFGSLTARLSQKIQSLTTAAHGTHVYEVGFWPMKYRAEDSCEVEIPELAAVTGIYHLMADVEEGFLPGRLVLRKTSEFNGELHLGTCEVEFAEPEDGSVAGFPNLVRMERPEDAATLVVGDGIEAILGGLSNIVGRLVKKGAGRIVSPVFGLGGATGVLSIQEGEFSLSDDGEGGPWAVARLELGAGAVLELPACGLRCGEFIAAPGAVVSGGGNLFLPETADVSGVSFGPDVKVVRVVGEQNTIRVADMLWDIPPRVSETTLPGNPAVWLDITTHASDIVLKEDVQVESWADRRGPGFPVAKNAGTCPQVRTNEQGQVRFVSFALSGSSDQTRVQSFKFEVGGVPWRISGIRHVFKVLCLASGCPQPMGNSDLKAVSADYDQPIFKDVSPLISNTVLRVNGEMRDWRTGYPYPGGTRSGSPYLLSSPVDKAVKSVVEYAVPMPGAYAGGLGYNGKSVSGRENLYECIVFTNELTETERVQVTDYLMRKWMAAEANFETGCGRTLDSVPADVRLEIPSGRVLNAKSVSGSGVFVKHGEGAVCIDDLVNAEMSIDVREGVFSVRSFATDGELPCSPYFHVDAGRVDSMTVEDGRVVAWRDVRGAGYPVATPIGIGPELETTGELASAVAFGAPGGGAASTYEGQSTGLQFAPVGSVHTIVSVADTSEGGGYLLGSADLSHSYVDTASLSLYGLWRGNNKSGVHTLTSKMLYAGSYTVQNYIIQFCTRGAGAPWGRLNGADVDLSSTVFTGGADIYAFTDYENLNASALNHICYNAANVYYGGQKLAETMIFTNALSRASVRKIEAGLRKKWFGMGTVGFRPAKVAGLRVASGSEVRVVGGAPLAVSALSGGGQVLGSLDLLPDAELTVSVDGCGQVSLPSVSDGFVLSGGGRVRLVGDVGALACGDYDLGAVCSSERPGTWGVIVEVPTRKEYAVRVSDGRLVLSVSPRGMILIVR